jgi:zinc protease
MRITKHFFERITWVVVLMLFMVSCGGEDTNSIVERSYTMVENDPLNTRIYELDNGLKVYLSVNKDEPRIQTNIAVRAGSKNDPADATGLAHYLEHMLFKGNSRIACLNWDKEKVVLEKISALYEQNRQTNDEEAKRNIYLQIDSLSQVAANFAVPNEYDKMISSLGAKGTNAYTSNERTVYVNDIPSNQLEKWLDVEANRFSELTLRLFHTELETVYEEFNRAQDNDYFKAYIAMYQLLFPNHQYGTQSTIGKGEHLKNPSMVKIHDYFDTYYVPNNMAICLAGDLDYEETISLIEKYFGNMKRKEVPVYKAPKEEPIAAVQIKEVKGPNTERVSIGFRLNGSDSKDWYYLKLLDGIMSNGKAGLIDLNLEKKQKVLRAYSNPQFLKDYAVFTMAATPKQGQSLDEAKALLMQQLELVKKGAFDDWLMQAVINDFKLQETRRYDNNMIRGYTLVDAFILDKDWGTYIHRNDTLEQITKAQLVAYANEKFKDDNYVVVYKRTGMDETTHKVDKPKITPLAINRDDQSAYAKYFDSLPDVRLDPVFLDYEKDIFHGKVAGLTFNAIKNTSNELFTLQYIFDMGKNHDLEMALAIEYLPFLGTSSYSAEELTKEFFKLGVDFSVYTGEDRIYVTLIGLQASFEKGLALFEQLMADAQPDEQALSDLVSNILKERADQKKEKYVIQRVAMMNYAKHGASNPFKNALTAQELKTIPAADLTKHIHTLTSYPHQVFYYGPEKHEEIITAIEKHHHLPKELLPYPQEQLFPELEMTTNQVLFVDYDMVQTEVLMLSKGQQFNKTLMPYASIFNEYFGAGLSSIVFQEIREAKALAYSAYSFYTTPSRKEESHYVQAYLGTQTDKLPDAVNALLKLMNEMPEAQGQFNDSRLASLKKIETDRITKASVFWNYFTAQKRGLDHDIRKDMYKAIKKMDMNGLKAFFDENIKGKNYTFLVIGKRKEVDFDALKKLGAVKELKLEEIFGY